jgi:hypothetical protein
MMKIEHYVRYPEQATLMEIGALSPVCASYHWAKALGYAKANLACTGWSGIITQSWKQVPCARRQI